MIRSKVFSFNSIAIFIGVAGVLSAIVTLFVDVNSLISTKWILFLTLLFLTTSSVLIKIALDLSNEKVEARKVFEKPIKANAEQQIFVTRLNPLFTPNCIVGGYLVEDEVEAFAFAGYVYHTQENLIQIKLVLLLDDVTKELDLFEKKVMNKIIIRPVIPFGFIDALGGVK